MNENLLVLICAVIGAAAVGVYYWVKSKRDFARSLTLDDAAESLGFTHSDDRERALKGVSELPLFAKAHQTHIENLMFRDQDGARVEIFDFSIANRSMHQCYEPHSQTVFKIRSVQLKLPVFAMRPEGAFDEIDGAFGSEDIDFDSHPEFSRRYRLRGPDEDAIRAAFGAQLLSHLEGTWRLHVEGAGDTLVSYRPDKRMGADEIQSVLSAGMALFNAFLSCGSTRSGKGTGDAAITP